MQRKTLLIISLIILIMFFATHFFFQEKDSDLVGRCPEYVKYDPNLKAWYWQVPVNNDYFPTNKDALDNCVNFWKKQ